MATLIPTNVDEPTEEIVPVGPTFSLDELQALVGGDIEAVPLADGRLVLINEHGKHQDLPFNLRATAMLEGQLLPFDVIVGPAVICTRREMGED